MSDHASLSPSSAYRWFVCPGSVRLTAHLPDNSNHYAREGTAAHTLGERCLKTGTAARSWIGTQAGRIRVDYEEDGEKKSEFFYVDEAMARHVQVYIDYCRQLGSVQGATVLIESQVGLGLIDERLAQVWGTADCIVYDPETRTLHVVDLKYGAGKWVDVEDNLQLRIYALAAWATHGDRFAPDRIVATIVQPRIGDEHVRSAEFSASSLFDFAQDVVDAVERVAAKDAPLVPGHHCDFCKAKTTCPALRKGALVVADDERALTPAYNLTMEEIVELVAKGELLEEWLSGLRAYLHEAALNGKDVPGYKLVPKRGQRHWAKDPKEVAEQLSLLVDEDSLYEERKLLSVAQMEKVVGKKNLPTKLVVTISNGYNLVKESNPAPGITLHPGSEFEVLE